MKTYMKSSIQTYVLNIKNLLTKVYQIIKEYWKIKFINNIMKTLKCKYFEPFLIKYKMIEHKIFHK